MAGKKIVLITEDQVAHIHELILARDGGLPGHRLNVSLSSVLDRVRNHVLFNSEYATVKSVAALATYALAVGYPFNDGNKRTALAAGIVVLRLNRARGLPDANGLKRLVVKAAAGKIYLAGFVSEYSGLIKPVARNAK